MEPQKSELLSSWREVFPDDANPMGTMFGGKIMAAMDIMSGIVASKFCNKIVVTASMEALDFRNPVIVGYRLEIIARVVYVGKTSMVVKTDVYSENPLYEERKHCTTAYFNMVALDENGKPTIVPQLLVETEQEKKDYELAKIIKQSAIERKNKA